MSDPQPEPASDPEVAHGELVAHGDEAAVPVPVEEERREAVEEPAKVMRIGSMIKQLLEEVRTAELDAPARTRLKEIYDTSVQELGTALSPDLREELERVTIPFGGAQPSDAELRVAQAQLVGWLEGLFHGIQATLFAQQMAARGQLEEMRRQLGPGGGPVGPGGIPAGAAGPGAPADPGDRPGTYL
ncbi:hypothetical protein BH10ACT1_BH10ACT1_31640 [soil metagenome]